MHADIRYDLLTPHSEPSRLDYAPWLWFGILSGVALFSGILMLFGLKSNIAFAPLGIFLLVLIFAKPAWGIILTLATYTLDQVFDAIIPTVTSPGRILVVLVLLSTTRLIVANRYRMLSTKVPVVTSAILVCWFTISILWAPDKYEAMIYVLQVAILLIFAAQCVLILAQEKLLLRAIFLGVCAAVIAAIYLVRSGESIWDGSERRLRFEGLGINSIAATLGVAVTFGMYYIAVVPSLVKRLAMVGMTGIIFIMMFPMGSRSALIGLPIAFAFAVLLAYRNRPHKIVLPLLLGMFFLVGLFIYALNQDIVTGDLRERILGVFEIATWKENPRLRLAKMVVVDAIRSPLGIGTASEWAYYERKGAGAAGDAILESHNTILSTLLQTGFVGFMLLTIVLVSTFRKAITIVDARVRLMVTFVFVYWILQVLTASLFSTRVYWFPLAIIWVMLEIAERNRLLMAREQDRSNS